MRVEINELENRKTVEKIKVTKNWFLEKIDKIGKTLARLTQRKRLKLVESEITGIAKMERIVKEYYGQLYTNKLHSLDKMDKFLER